MERDLTVALQIEEVHNLRKYMLQAEKRVNAEIESIQSHIDKLTNLKKYQNEMQQLQKQRDELYPKTIYKRLFKSNKVETQRIDLEMSLMKTTIDVIQNSITSTSSLPAANVQLNLKIKEADKIQTDLNKLNEKIVQESINREMDYVASTMNKQLQPALTKAYELAM